MEPLQTDDPAPPTPSPTTRALQPCRTCGNPQAPTSASNGPGTFIYAVGRIEPRFPRLSVEKEFAQVAAQSETAGLTDRQVLHAVLSKRENRYLARQLCWVLSIEGLDAYILMPRDPAEFDLLVQSLRPVPSPVDVDVVIGTRISIAPPDLCNGLQIPIVAFDQIYSFDRDSLIQSIPKPDDAPEKEFAAASYDLLDRILQITDNFGATDEHRALNFLVLRYPAIYARAAEAYAGDSSLTAVDVRQSALSGPRKIVEVIFSYTNRTTDVTEKLFVRVDVTDEFPFLVTKLSSYFDR